MERLFRFLLVAVFAVVFVSCGVFFSSMDGRWNIKDPDKRIIVVPCIKCKSIDTCEGIVMADTGLTDIY